MRRLILLMALSILLSGVSVTASDMLDPDTPQEVQVTALDLIVNRMILTFWAASRSDDPFTPPEAPMTLKNFVRSMPKIYRDRIIERDPWGGDYMIGESDYIDLWIGSGGKDGHLRSIEDFEAAFRQSEANSAQRDLKLFIGDDLVVIDDEIIWGPMTESDRQARSMRDVRMIAVATESFSIDENRYPFQDTDLAPVNVIENDLEPLYIQTMPLIDGWGQPFLFWSDGQNYIVLSMGADGILDQQIRSGVPGTKAGSGATTDPNADIIFANGQFTQWPKDLQQ